MNDSQQSTVLTRFGALLVFSSLTLAVFVWFGWSVFHLYAQIVVNDPVIVFDKGVLYMFGAGAALATLTFGGLYEGILRRPLTEKITRIITNSIIGSIVIMFVLPQIIHYPVERFLEGRGYNICTQASYRWLLYRRIVYVSSAEACSSLGESDK